MLKILWEKMFKDRAVMWTALFNGILTLTTINLLCLNQRALDVSIAQQRAFISVSMDPRIETIVDPTSTTIGAVKLLIRWQNDGTTPAKSTIGRSNSQVFRPALPEGFSFRDREEKASSPEVMGVIGPKGVNSHSITITMEDLREVHQKKSRLYFWGWITYRDTFPDTLIRLTEFCIEMINVTASKPNIADPSGNINTQYIHCSETHNCYDEDCPDYKERIERRGALLSSP